MVRRRSLLATAGAILLTLALSASTFAASGTRMVQMLDACDGPSFNAVIGDGTCIRPGGVTFDEFIGQLIEGGQAPAWRFSPTLIRIGAGGQIGAVNRGGEFHTFTEVADFGGGCVDELNQLLGLTPVPECDDPSLFGTTGAGPGGVVETGPLDAGSHKFMCLIHPWMKSTVAAD